MLARDAVPDLTATTLLDEIEKGARAYQALALTQEDAESKMVTCGELDLIFLDQPVGLVQELQGSKLQYRMNSGSEYMRSKPGASEGANRRRSSRAVLKCRSEKELMG